ncbi:stage III sporulation protein AF [Clostridium botulinum]|uniref:Stage III sporulation protein AF n=1 Tax=Clostridium botulinum (strain Okra / Type B1) TaxID=498213 RepID=B1IMP3_CLOBK|nr:stage III sporulation protein AF [Clostridium botulinum]EKX79326.1 stage III sporulation protein AF [Clostridium botulinum CFSAN001628]ACA46601.1 stage III sporulation protein AF [Clostridium botulinum B1 str. Okra]MBD5564635.1 stage III sporulation protein AF [Clostridium botulinum]MBD5566301.1 stage III sporulation protein AF [Clostridium botulinum]MBD5569183.1 stage III sporulation protein AF [Clostridium botulinum]
MLQWLKEWITNIAVAVFFITAIEMLLPKNNIKKYGKFVLGLILITVILNPIIKIFNKDYNISQYVEKATASFNNVDYKNDFDKYKKKNKEETLNNFKANLQNQTKKRLEEKFPENKYEVNVEIAYDEEKDNLEIKSMDVGVKGNKIEKIKKVNKINIGSNENGKEDKKSFEGEGKIKQFISNEFKVSSEVIKVYKL